MEFESNCGGNETVFSSECSGVTVGKEVCIYSVYFVFNVEVTLARSCKNTQYRSRNTVFSMAVCCVVEYIHSVSLIIGVYSDFLLIMFVCK